MYLSLAFLYSILGQVHYLAHLAYSSFCRLVPQHVVLPDIEYLREWLLSVQGRRLRSIKATRKGILLRRTECGGTNLLSVHQVSGPSYLVV